MARPLRVEYAGAVYHVTARGHERGAIFRADEDREMFLQEVERRFEEERWVVHGYCLMTNHYHLLIETPEANLAGGMQRLNGRYSQAFNASHRRKGHLLEDRYKSTVVEKESYLLELCRYVVLNPVRAGMVRSAREWRWSNYRATAGDVERPRFLEVDWTLACFGKEKAKAREAYRRFVAEGRGSGEPEEGITNKAFLGSPAFLEEMRRRLERLRISEEVPQAQRLESYLELEKVIEAVAKEFGIEAAALMEPWRRGEERAVAVYLARKLTGLPGKEIAKAFGVSGARVSQLAGQVEGGEDASLRRRVEQLRQRLAKAALG